MHLIGNKSSQACRFKRYTYSGTLQHPKYVVEQLNILALSHLHFKEYEQSESNLKKALKIAEFHTSPESKKPWNTNLLVYTLSSLAKLEESRDNKSEALPFLVRMNEITTKAFEEKKTPLNAVTQSLRRLGALQYNLGNQEEAKSEFNKIIELEREEKKIVTSEAFTLNSASALYYLGRIEFDNKNFESAQTLLEKSWEIFRTLTGPLTADVYNVLLELGKVYLAVGNYSRARTVIEGAGQGFESFVYDEPKTLEAQQIWQEIAQHLGVKAVRSLSCTPNRDGFSEYPKGESPKEEKDRRHSKAHEKRMLADWKKSHGIAKYEDE